MSPVAALSGWSRQRLIMTITGLFLAQLAAIWVLGERASIKPGKGRAFDIQLSGPNGTGLPAVPVYDDPTLFALPHPRGFSGQAWLHVPEQVHQYHEWTAQPHWLSLKASGLGQDFCGLPADAFAPGSLAGGQAGTAALPGESRD